MYVCHVTIIIITDKLIQHMWQYIDLHIQYNAIVTEIQ